MSKSKPKLTPNNIENKSFANGGHLDVQRIFKRSPDPPERVEYEASSWSDRAVLMKKGSEERGQRPTMKRGSLDSDTGFRGRSRAKGNGVRRRTRRRTP